jgi:hypothetical protein
MKTILIVLIVALSISVKAQNSGVYLSAADFESGKLTYAIDCATEKHKIKLNEFLGKDYITVVHDKQSYNLKKNEIFGYRDCNDLIYRLAIDRHYKVLNPKETILLYVIEVAASKNQMGTKNYYFSSSASSEVKELTLTNLKKAFPDNHKFHDALDAEFKSDSELAVYDSFHKTYKVNRLYSNSVSH